MPPIAWILIAAVLTAALLVTLYWVLRARDRDKPVPMPTEWAVAARPVFSADERRVYRLLREALPHHIVLSKLPLVRFCQPNDPAEVNYWYELLGANHVTFAVCSANGRVLAAIDLDTDRGSSRRVATIKQSVLSACRVRYLRCPVDNLPSVAELQLLVPQPSVTARGPQPASAPPQDLHQARDSLASTVANRRAERSALWQDSSLFQDSFFVPDSRLDGLGHSEFPSLTGAHAGAAARLQRGAAERDGASESGDDIAGVVVDAPRIAANSRH
jgi:hypothetical protein